MYVKPKSASESSSVTMQMSFMTQSGSSAKVRAQPLRPPASGLLSLGPILAGLSLPPFILGGARANRGSGGGTRDLLQKGEQEGRSNILLF